MEKSIELTLCAIILKISSNQNPKYVTISGNRLSRRFMLAIPMEFSRIKMEFAQRLPTCKRRCQKSALIFHTSKNPEAIANVMRRWLSAFLSLSGDGVLSRRSQCDLGATLDNLANFIEKNPIYFEQS